MNITLIKEKRGEEISLVLEETNITIENLYEKYRGALPYKVLAAKVDNKVVELTDYIKEGTRVEFLDVRDQNANLIYQNSLILVFLKATCDVLGEVDVDIENAINQGVYCTVKLPESPTRQNVKDIEKRIER